MGLPIAARVFRNLTRKCFSVQVRVTGKGWRTVAHASHVALSGVSFLVSENGRQRVLQTGRKHVHAFVQGELLAWSGVARDTAPQDLEAFRAVPDDVLPSYDVFYSECDPDEEEGRDPDGGWYFQLQGGDSASGPYGSEGSAERAADDAAEEDGYEVRYNPRRAAEFTAPQLGDRAVTRAASALLRPSGVLAYQPAI